MNLIAATPTILNFGMVAQPALPYSKIKNCGGNDNIELDLPPQLEENFLPTQTQMNK